MDMLVLKAMLREAVVFLDETKDSKIELYVCEILRDALNSILKIANESHMFTEDVIEFNRLMENYHKGGKKIEKIDQ